MMSSRVVLGNPERMGKRGLSAVRDLVEALISAGVAAGIAGSSRPCSGSEHLFSHSLDVVSPGRALHGEQCGVGTIMMAKLQGLDWKEVRRALKLVGAPTKASELNISDDEVVAALVGRRRYARTGPRFSPRRGWTAERPTNLRGIRE